MLKKLSSVSLNVVKIMSFYRRITISDINAIHCAKFKNICSRHQYLEDWINFEMKEKSENNS